MDLRKLNGGKRIRKKDFASRYNNTGKHQETPKEIGGKGNGWYIIKKMRQAE